MKVKELIEKLKQFDQELEVVTNWDDSAYSFHADLVTTDTVKTIVAVDARYRGFYIQADADALNPSYPDVKAREFVTIT